MKDTMIRPEEYQHIDVMVEVGVEPKKGSTVCGAISEALDVAGKSGKTVVFKFNETEIEVVPGSCANCLFLSWEMQRMYHRARMVGVNL